MRYDLETLEEYYGEVGLKAQIADSSALHVLLGDNAVLCFQNAEREDDCLVGFLNCSWHFHGDTVEFSDNHGPFVKLDPLNY